MGHFAMQCQFKLLIEGVILERHGEAAIFTHIHYFCVIVLFTELNNRCSRFLLIRIMLSIHRHPDKILFRQRLCRQSFQIVLKARNGLFALADLLREVFPDLILQTVSLAVMIGFH